jgi:hypothetical protein
MQKILLFLLENYDQPEPINIGNTEEHSSLVLDLQEQVWYWNSKALSGKTDRLPYTN